jgi:putative sterol carrier protein
MFWRNFTVAKFPNDEWVHYLKEKLNTDQKYAQVARNWEGDFLVQVEPGGALTERITYYLDLWHGKCRDAHVLDASEDKKAAFTLKAPYGNYIQVIKGDLDPMQAMLTRKLSVKGNMAVLMRNIPTVLDFVRCCREITDSFL